MRINTHNRLSRIPLKTDKSIISINIIPSHRNVITSPYIILWRNMDKAKSIERTSPSQVVFALDFIAETQWRQMRNEVIEMSNAIIPTLLICDKLSEFGVANAGRSECVL